MASKALIQTEHVSVLREEEAVLDDVSFTIHAEEYVGIVGPNGGGKTTLLLAMLGLLQPTKGRVLIRGQAPQQPKALERVGYVPQTFLGRQFSFPITVEEVVATGLIKPNTFGPFQKKEWKEVTEILEEVGMRRYQKRSFHELSGGERQRVIIARALVSQPEILFLDEPLSAVDQPSQTEFYKLLTRLNKERGLTIILVSHDLEMVAREASRVLCLNQKLHLNCTTSKLKGDENWADVFGDRTKPIHHHKH
jgi:zinc transport system ATP-binding protein